MDVGRYPTDTEGLGALITRPDDAEVWNGPYIKGGQVPVDPWGHAYQYHTVSDHTPPYDVNALGPEGHGVTPAKLNETANSYVDGRQGRVYADRSYFGDGDCGASCGARGRNDTGDSR